MTASDTNGTGATSGASTEALVRNLAAFQVPEVAIAAAIGCTVEELLERHGQTLAKGRANAVAQVRKAMFDAALKGDHKAASMFMRQQPAALPSTPVSSPAPSIVTCNFDEMANALGVSKPTLRDWITKWEDFPVVARGSNGVAWQFDTQAVISFVADRREQEAAANARRIEQLGQIALPLGGPVTSDGNEMPLAEMAQLYKLARAADDLALSRRQLLRPADVRPLVSDLLTRLRHQMTALPRQWAARHNLPAAVGADMKRDVEDALTALHAGLREHLTSIAVAEPDGNTDAVAASAA